jgi:hypothetical protein
MRYPSPMAARKQKARTARVVRPDPDAIFAAKTKRTSAFAFVLEELEPLDPHTRFMFGGIAVYVEENIVMMLADKERLGGDRGVWIATTKEHHTSLKTELPSMRTITVFGSAVSSWQNLPADALSFEDDVLRACALIRAADPRIGKVPARRRRAVSPSPKGRKRSRARRSNTRTRRRARR